MQALRGIFCKRRPSSGAYPQKNWPSLCGESVDNIRAVFRGSREINSELAESLEKILGIGAYIWLGLEEDYQETLKRIGESRPS